MSLPRIAAARPANPPVGAIGWDGRPPARKPPRIGELRGERMDNETAAALSAVQTVFEQPELHVELGFAPGQIQYVNNRATGHARRWREGER